MHNILGGWETPPVIKFLNLGLLIYMLLEQSDLQQFEIPVIDAVLKYEDLAGECLERDLEYVVYVEK